MTRSLRFTMALAANNGRLGVGWRGLRFDNIDRRVRLINQSHQTITEFYASNIKSTGWEERYSRLLRSVTRTFRRHQPE